MKTKMLVVGCVVAAMVANAAEIRFVGGELNVTAPLSADNFVIDGGRAVMTSAPSGSLGELSITSDATVTLAAKLELEGGINVEAGRVEFADAALSALADISLTLGDGVKIAELEESAIIGREALYDIDASRTDLYVRDANGVVGIGNTGKLEPATASRDIANKDYY